MKNTLILAVFGISWLPALAGAAAVNVLSASSTSHSQGSTPITCLLEAGCRGAWSPGSADTGANEGVYVQFETPTLVDAIELVSNDKSGSVAYVLSVNGAPVAQAGEPGPAAGGGRKAYAVRFSMPGTNVKSLFFRLAVRKGGWKHFALYAIRFYIGDELLQLNNPVLVPATVTATSQLEPKVAYQPANLFDSRYDFAWSTNGKTTKGPGESIEIQFKQPQNIGGLLVWNGYQRSQSHYQANGRVTRLTVSTKQGKQQLNLADKSGVQKRMLDKPLKQVSSLRLTIDAVEPGKKYRDVLISELRFLDDQGRIVLPQVTGILPKPSALSAKLVGRSLSSLVCSSSVVPGNFQRSFRLRKNGSFVIYSKAYDSEGKKTDRVMEGNWDQRGPRVRIFGKRYAETVLETEYSQTKTKVPASIFQSDLKIARFRNLKPRAQEQLAGLIWSRLVGKAMASQAEKLVILGTDNRVLASGRDKKTLRANLVAVLKQRNPWTIRSPILADAVLPSDEIGACEISY